MLPRRLPQDVRESSPAYQLRAIEQGAAAVNDADLIRLVTGCDEETADKIIEQIGLHELAKTYTADTLGEFLSRRRCLQLLAGIELGRRTLQRVPKQREQFNSPRELASYLLPMYGSSHVEQFGVVCLDTRHRLIRSTLVSVGSLDSAPAHPREIFGAAIRANASAIALWHNHPSGDPTPSVDDNALTRRLILAGEAVGIEVLDHLILTETRYYSYKEAGKF